MYNGYDPAQGPAVPNKKYGAGPFVGLGICQIIFGVINATGGIIYVAHIWHCYNFCPKYGGFTYVGAGIWSGGLLILAGSVACGAGGEKTKGCASGTIATSALSMVASVGCIAFTAVDLYRFFNYGFYGYERGYLMALLITLTASSLLAFILSIILIVFGTKGWNTTKNTVYPGQPIWGLGDGTMPGMVGKDTNQLVIPTPEGPITFVPQQQIGNSNETEQVEMEQQ